MGPHPRPGSAPSPPSRCGAASASSWRCSPGCSPLAVIFDPAGQPLQRPVPPAVVPPRLPLGRVGRCDGGDRRRRPVAVVGGAHRPAREPSLHGRQPVLRAATSEEARRVAEPASPAGEEIALYSEPSGRRGAWPVAAVAGPLVALVVALGVVATPFVLPASAMKSIGITPGPNQVTNWSSFNYSGYQAQAAYPEYRALVQTMERVGATYGCGQAMWQYDPSLNRFGTTQALYAAAVLVERLHRLDGGAALRVLGHDAVPLPQPGRALGHPVRGDGRPGLLGAERARRHPAPAAARASATSWRRAPRSRPPPPPTPRSGRWPRPGPGRRARPASRRRRRGRSTRSWTRRW